MLKDETPNDEKVLIEYVNSTYKWTLAPGNLYQDLTD